MAEKINGKPQIKYMNLDEFVSLGLLAEVNRRFFHPIGLALAYEITPAGKVVKLAGIQDFRDAPGGVSFGIQEWETAMDDRFYTFLQGKIRYNSELTKRAKKREKELGSVIEDAKPLKEKSAWEKKLGL